MSGVTHALTWRRDGADWILVAGRRRFGRVVPDQKYPGMYRSILSRGRLSDMANLSWAKNAVLAAAERELEWEQRSAITPSKCPVNEGVFSASSTPMLQTGQEASLVPDDYTALLAPPAMVTDGVRG